MTSLAEIMKEYIKETKGRIDFNKIPEQVIRFTKRLSAVDLEVSYEHMTHKKQFGKTQSEMINEMIFMLLNYKREM